MARRGTSAATVAQSAAAVDAATTTATVDAATAAAAAAVDAAAAACRAAADARAAADTATAAAAATVRTDTSDSGAAAVRTSTPGRYVQLTISGRQLIALCDTGSDHTVVRKDVLEADVHLLPVERPVKLANDEQCTGILGLAYADVRLGPFTTRTCVYVADSLCEPCLLGADLLTASAAVLDISKGEMTVLGKKLVMTGKVSPGDPASRQWCQTGAVRIARTVVVPASSEMIMAAQVSVPTCSRVSEQGHEFCCKGPTDADAGAERYGRG